mmetsp:Transcript_127630/g.330848  ORF Transcript_127630/g.330848 Transcript_127630/m.330848 type:complete len:381 (+) Transcript_127630:1293-2435(+)|eukprot:CAMPEP_0115194994 /NCGR_PEP_ID=MMETSP0270-20121206/14352_1 /TAXON_ID=71861 /ORGANISM="Scrippsiella trochoidea, Strain CCMP3099" /LENGTH=380 /DNA_ID=CAMNT_0002608303 /DNA_START=1346 /DNA_END=2488 /DNA_ORIENTATION=-
MFQHRLVRLISLLYGAALSEVSEMQSNAFEFIDIDDFEHESLEFLEASSHKCEIVLQWVQRLIVEAHDTNILKVAPPILTRVYNQLGNGIVILNNAEKLNDFPMPFPLAQIIIFMLLLHWGITALVVATSMSHPVWVFLTSFAAVFGFWGVHYIGLELEQPFGDDPNDVPLCELQRVLNTSLRELMHVRARTPPKFKFVPAKHQSLQANTVSLGAYTQTRRLHLMMAEQSQACEKLPAITIAQLPSISSALSHSYPPGTTSSSATKSVSFAARSSSIARKSGQLEIRLADKENLSETTSEHSYLEAARTDFFPIKSPEPELHLESSILPKPSSAVRTVMEQRDLEDDDFREDVCGDDNGVDKESETYMCHFPLWVAPRQC